MTQEEQRAIDLIMSRLSEDAYKVFTVATEAIMKADPEAERLNRIVIIEGLTAAIEIARVYERYNKAN